VETADPEHHKICVTTRLSLEPLCIVSLKAYGLQKVWVVST